LPLKSDDSICIVVLKLDGPFLAGLIAFCLSAGFFAVFFISGFMELSRHMKIPDLWAGISNRRGFPCSGRQTG
jgi:hypothetical protein